MSIRQQSLRKNIGDTFHDDDLMYICACRPTPDILTLTYTGLTGDIEGHTYPNLHFAGIDCCPDLQDI